MLGGLAVCAMCEGDISAVASIELSSFPQSPGARADDLMPTSEARLREELSRPWSQAWVIRGEGARALSFLVAWHVVDEVHVLNVAVDPAHRRQGMGLALVAQVISFARQNRARLVLLEVCRSNLGAIRMYRAAGFVATGFRHRYYSDGQDAVTMELMLDSRTGDILERTDKVSLDA
jgi:ribosomal-protein-alanine N-acetyltransferase